jgi:hypothetical protein
MFVSNFFHYIIPCNVIFHLHIVLYALHFLPIPVLLFQIVSTHVLFLFMC